MNKIQKLFPCIDLNERRKLQEFQKQLDMPIRPPSRRLRLDNLSSSDRDSVPCVISCKMTVDSSDRSDHRRWCSSTDATHWWHGLLSTSLKAIALLLAGALCLMLVPFVSNVNYIPCNNVKTQLNNSHGSLYYCYPYFWSCMFSKLSLLLPSVYTFSSYRLEWKNR